LRRILIEIETSRAESEVEVDDDGIDAEMAGGCPGNVVRDRRRADAASSLASCVRSIVSMSALKTVVLTS
jgi:hypothetical protein